MKLRTMSCLLAALILLASSAAAQLKPAAGFDKLKSLVGEWEGKGEGGRLVHVSYKFVSGGSALLETLSPSGEPEMLTVYNLDGSNLMLTHYCSSGNQPRMRAVPPATGSPELGFVFLDATNMTSPDAGHMRKLTIRFEDDNHFSQTWTWRQGGKDESTVFHFTRRR